MPPRKKVTETSNVHKVTPVTFISNNTTETIKESITVMPTPPESIQAKSKQPSETMAQNLANPPNPKAATAVTATSMPRPHTRAEQQLISVG